jgi:hypothetical protein
MFSVRTVAIFKARTVYVLTITVSSEPRMFATHTILEILTPHCELRPEVSVWYSKLEKWTCCLKSCKYLAKIRGLHHVVLSLVF